MDAKKIAKSKGTVTELPTTVTRFIPLLREGKEKWVAGPVCAARDGHESAQEWLTQRTHTESLCRIVEVELPLES